MNTEICFEMYHSKYQQFDLVNNNKDQIFNSSTISEHDREFTMMKEKKFDYYLLTRMYNRNMFGFEQYIMMIT